MPARKMDLTDLMNRLRATFSKISQAIKTWVLCVSVDKAVTWYSKMFEILESYDIAKSYFIKWQ